MFNYSNSEQWLDENADKAMTKLSNRIAHLEQNTYLEQDLQREMSALRNDVDRRFEQIERRFGEMDNRINGFIQWSLTAIMISCTGVVITFIFLATYFHSV